uniref:Uncharacterized protein n=1 Tax=Arion vulgaris TaxID=1028688 RepID=A0A0B6ZSR1_9EUPU
MSTYACKVWIRLTSSDRIEHGKARRKPWSSSASGIISSNLVLSLDTDSREQESDVDEQHNFSSL